MQFTGTYENLKEVVAYLAEQSGRLTIDNMNASYDTSTGYLTGSIVVNMFSMAGTGNTYAEPDAGQVAYGTSNLFGTLDQAAANAEQGSEGDGSDGQNDNSQEGENTDETEAPADDQSQS